MERVMYTLMDNRISMAVVGFQYAITKTTVFFFKKNKGKIRGSIEASNQQSTKIYQVSHYDPFSKRWKGSCV
jgi:hypothetical protein